MRPAPRPIVRRCHTVVRGSPIIGLARLLRYPLLARHRGVIRARAHRGAASASAGLGIRAPSHSLVDQMHRRPGIRPRPLRGGGDAIQFAPAGTIAVGVAARRTSPLDPMPSFALGCDAQDRPLGEDMRALQFVVTRRETERLMRVRIAAGAAVFLDRRRRSAPREDDARGGLRDGRRGGVSGAHRHPDPPWSRRSLPQKLSPSCPRDRGRMSSA